MILWFFLVTPSVLEMINSYLIFDQHQNKMSASNLLNSTLYKPHSVVSFIKSAERAAPV